MRDKLASDCHFCPFVHKASIHTEICKGKSPCGEAHSPPPRRPQKIFPSKLQAEDEESNTSTEDALSKSSSSAALHADFSTQQSPSSSSSAALPGGSGLKLDWSPQSLTAGKGIYCLHKVLPITSMSSVAIVAFLEWMWLNLRPSFQATVIQRSWS